MGMGRARARRETVSSAFCPLPSAAAICRSLPSALVSAPRPGCLRSLIWKVFDERPRALTGPARNDTRDVDRRYADGCDSSTLPNGRSDRNASDGRLPVPRSRLPVAALRRHLASR